MTSHDLKLLKPSRHSLLHLNTPQPFAIHLNLLLLIGIVLKHELTQILMIHSLDAKHTLSELQ